VGNRPLSRLRRALAPAGTLVLNGGGSPGRVVGTVGAMLKAAVVNGFVRQRLRILPTREDRAELARLWRQSTHRHCPSCRPYTLTPGRPLLVVTTRTRGDIGAFAMNVADSSTLIDARARGADALL
jgi:hypothetical protein